MSNVGYATLPVIPSVRGIGSAVAQQISAPLARESSAAGQTAGNNIKNGILGVARTIAGPLLAYAGFSALKSGISSAIDAASDLGEAGTAVQAVFGTAFPAIEKWSASSSKALGQSQLQALKAAQTFGVYGKAAGLADGANLEFSTGLAALSTDLASFYNSTPEEAMQAIASGLRGEAEPLRAYGVLLDDATLRQKALELGLISTTKNALTPQQRVLAAQASILEQTSIAQGDFEKTSAGLANQQRISAALWTDISARIGGLFLPGVVAAQTALNTRLLPAVGNTVDWLQNRLPGAITGVSDLLLRGDFTTGFREAFNVQEDSPVVDLLLRIRSGVLEVWTAVSPALTSIGAAFVTLGPPALMLWQAISPVSTLFQVLAPQLPAIAGAAAGLTASLAQLAAGGVQVLVPVLSTAVSWLVQAATWLSQNQGVVVALLGAWLAWRAVSTVLGIVRAAQAAYTAATYGAAGATYANVAASKAQAIAARIGAAAAALQSSVVWKSVAAWVANTGAVATNNSLTLATKAAIIASSVATGIATAAQWAWNAAVSANPIGIIIIAIAALVAGIIWLATQTTFFQDLWTNVVNVVSTAVTWLWESVISPVFTAIGAIFTWIWENILAPIVMLVVNYFRLWGAIVVWLWQNAVMPAVNAIGAVFTWLWQNVLKPVVDAIAAIFTWVWETILKPVFDGIAATVNALGAVFTWLLQNVIAPVWNGIQSTISAAWTWIDANVFTPFKLGIDLLGKAFESTAKFIGDAWNNIKSAAAMPINFVLDTVWNKGLRSFWNDMVTTLGLSDMKLPAAQLIKFANGSENHVAQIAGAGAMRLWAEPETGGEAYIPLSPAKRSRSTAILANVANRFGFGITPYANGGIGDGAGNLVGDVLDNIAGAASVAWEFLTNPAAAIEKHIVDGIIGPLLGDASPWLRAIGQLPINLVRGFTGKLKDAAPKAAPAASGGMGWQALWQMVQAGVPGAVKTSDFRPGSRTVNGGQSYHALGRAIDVIPATMATFNRMLAMFPNARELIFSPAGGRQLQNGKPHNWGGAVRAQHWDHVHLAMANGGVIPGLAAGANIRARRGGTVAILGEGGRSETVSDLGLTNRTMAATLALVNKASEPSRDDSINFNGPVTVADPDELARRLQRKRRRARAKAGVDGKVSIP